MAPLAPAPPPSRIRTTSAEFRPESDRERPPGSGRATARGPRDAGPFALDWEAGREPVARDDAYWSRPMSDDSSGCRNSAAHHREASDGELAISIGRSLGTVVVRLVGPVDTSAVTWLAATLGDLIEGQGNLAIAVDLRGVDRIVPSGVQVLSVAAYELERRGGRLSLRGARHCVLRALELADLARFVALDQGEPRGAASNAAGGSVSHLAPKRRPDAHPAGSGRHENDNEPGDDRA